MRIAIISDIHGNLEALETALEDIKKRGYDSIYCLGDIVGYGANPKECIALVREHCDGVVMGNHDEAAYLEGAELSFNSKAAIAAIWTRKQLSQEEHDYLKSLPMRLTVNDLLFVHSAPKNPQYWEYIFSAMQALAYADAFTERVCFVGHSHLPGVYSLDLKEGGYTPEGRFIINVGSIGQPRDGNPDLSYGYLDTVAGTYDNIRLPYNIDKAANKIREAGLPAILAVRLSEGR